MKRGFTLIEVMVVLSILAIIAILGYNFFGSMVREATLTSAATELHKNYTTLASAVEEDVRTRYLDGTIGSVVTKASSDGQFSAEGFPETLLPSLKSKVLAPSSGAESTCPHVANYGFYWRADYDVIGGTGKDFFVMSNCMTQDICEEYNSKFTTLTSMPTHGSPWPWTKPSWTTVGGGNASFCFKYGTEYRFAGLASVDI